MPIRQEIQTFWWFQQDRIGGMGKPGFNRTHWMDFSIVEAALFNWIGQHLYYRPALQLTDLWAYLDQFGPKVAPFYGKSEEEVMAHYAALRDPNTLVDAIQAMNKRAHIIEGNVTIEGSEGTNRLCLTFGRDRITQELASLQKHGVSALISLMEDPPSAIVMDSPIKAHHIPIPDLTPPTIEQVEAFSRLLFGYLDEGKSLAVHCFAGVGRTTTMLVAAHLLDGHSFDRLTQEIKVNNPHYQHKGAQWAYICNLNDAIQRGERPLLQR